MRTLSLKHLQPLACEAYAGLSIYPEKEAISTINEFTAELNTDIKNIRRVATPATASDNLEAMISKYQRRYEFHLTAWLQSAVQNKSAFLSPSSAYAGSEASEYRKLVLNRYNYFKQWRHRTVNMLTNGLKRAQTQRHPNERKRMQRIVKSDEGTKYLRKR